MKDSQNRSCSVACSKYRSVSVLAWWRLCHVSVIKVDFVAEKRRKVSDVTEVDLMAGAVEKVTHRVMYV